MPPPKLLPPRGNEVYELSSDEDFSSTQNEVVGMWGQIA
jgi:hypothetical protein